MKNNFVSRDKVGKFIFHLNIDPILNLLKKNITNEFLAYSQNIYMQIN